MQSTGKKVLLSAIKFLIPAAIIGFLIWRIEPGQWQQLSEQPKDYWLLLAALTAGLIAMSLSFTRWCVLVRCQGIELSMLEAFRLGSICFLLSFVSAGSVDQANASPRLHRCWWIADAGCMDCFCWSLAD
jgi:hypothetical protein